MLDVRTLVKTALLAAAVAGGAFMPFAARADDLQPNTAHMAKINDVSVLTFYAVEPDGYQVTMVTQAGDSETPSVLKITATLAPGQKIGITTPVAIGRDSDEFEIVHTGDSIAVYTRPSATADWQMPSRSRKRPPA